MGPLEHGSLPLILRLKNLLFRFFDASRSCLRKSKFISSFFLQENNDPIYIDRGEGGGRGNGLMIEFLFVETLPQNYFKTIVQNCFTTLSTF